LLLLLLLLLLSLSFSREAVVLEPTDAALRTAIDSIDRQLRSAGAAIGSDEIQSESHCILVLCLHPRLLTLGTGFDRLAAFQEGALVSALFSGECTSCSWDSLRCSHSPLARLCLGALTQTEPAKEDKVRFCFKREDNREAITACLYLLRGSAYS